MGEKNKTQENFPKVGSLINFENLVECLYGDGGYGVDCNRIINGLKALSLGASLGSKVEDFKKQVRLQTQSTQLRDMCFGGKVRRRLLLGAEGLGLVLAVACGVIGGTSKNETAQVESTKTVEVINNGGAEAPAVISTPTNPVIIDKEKAFSAYQTELDKVVALDVTENLNLGEFPSLSNINSPDGWKASSYSEFRQNGENGKSESQVYGFAEDGTVRMALVKSSDGYWHAPVRGKALDARQKPVWVKVIWKEAEGGELLGLENGMDLFIKENGIWSALTPCFDEQGNRIKIDLDIDEIKEIKVFASLVPSIDITVTEENAPLEETGNQSYIDWLSPEALKSRQYSEIVSIGDGTYEIAGVPGLVLKEDSSAELTLPGGEKLTIAVQAIHKVDGVWIAGLREYRDGVWSEPQSWNVSELREFQNSGETSPKFKIVILHGHNGEQEILATIRSEREKIVSPDKVDAEWNGVNGWDSKGMTHYVANEDDPNHPDYKVMDISNWTNVTLKNRGTDPTGFGGAAVANGIYTLEKFENNGLVLDGGMGALSPMIYALNEGLFQIQVANKVDDNWKLSDPVIHATLILKRLNDNLIGSQIKTFSDKSFFQKYGDGQSRGNVTEWGFKFFADPEASDLEFRVSRERFYPLEIVELITENNAEVIKESGIKLPTLRNSRKIGQNDRFFEQLFGQLIW